MSDELKTKIERVERKVKSPSSSSSSSLTQMQTDFSQLTKRVDAIEMNKASKRDVEKVM